MGGDEDEGPGNRLRDFDNPTAAFPIGSLNRGVAGRRNRDEEAETVRRPMFRIPIHSSRDLDDSEDDVPNAPPQPPVGGLDLRFLALCMLGASGLAMLAAVGAAVVVVLR